MTIALAGRTIRLLIPCAWTGSLTLNIISGHLSPKCSKVCQEHVVCTACGTGEHVVSLETSVGQRGRCRRAGAQESVE